MIFVFTVGLAFGQFSDKKAIWFYINTEPKNRENVVNKIKITKEIHDSINICNRLLKSDNTYVVSDTTVLKLNYKEPVFNNSLFQLKGNLCDTLTFELCDNKVKSKKAISIITKKGLIIIYNLEESILFINIKYKHITPLNQFMTFLVDNRVLKLYFDKTEDVEDHYCGSLDCFLKSHMISKLNSINDIKYNWEINSSKSLKIDNNEFLLWSIKTKDEMNVIADKQYYLTTLYRKNILVLNIISNKREKEKSIEKFFKTHHITIHEYQKFIDFNQIIIKLINNKQ